MGILDKFKPQPSMAELEDIEERKELELSIAQKNALIRQLKAQGQDPNHFKENGKLNFTNIINWLKKHFN
jgi:hypothetical protein